MLLRQDRDTASLFPYGYPAPALMTEQAFHLRQGVAQPAPHTTSAERKSFLRACKAKHMSPSWWAPRCMADLNNPHQQQDSHSAHLRMQPRCHCSMRIHVFAACRQGLQERQPCT